MAEMLIVVAIIIVLAAVAFIAVANYQRSMTQLEYDTIAKEIFIAAQNHLTTAESQGYNGLKNTETKAVYGQTSSFGTDPADKVYYIPSSEPGDAEEMLDLMLPFGSIDETVRAGGSYIIRYQPSSARVLEVFYSSPNQTSALTVKGTQLGSGDFDYGSLMEIRGDDEEYKSARRNFHNAVIGWYGDAEALPTGKKLEVPVVKIHNEEKLWVEVTDSNASETSLVLLVTGKTSQAQCKFVLRGDTADTTGRIVNGQKVVILDDITTANMRFAQIAGQKVGTPGGSKASFIPGEDLYIEAVAFNNKALTNIAYSGKQTTNSLFKSIDMEAAGDSQKPVAKIDNFRHLENLDPRVSAFASDACYGNDGDGNAIAVTNAKQVQDMKWTGSESAFLERIVTIPVAGGDKNSVQIYWYEDTGEGILTENTSNPGCYLPVNLSDTDNYALTYSGNSLSISNVKVDLDSGNAGLFGSLKGASVSDLELIDFSILTASGNAGALAGTLTDTTVKNVLARNTGTDTETKYAVNISASGSAGGLIGIQNDGSVNYSAAALIVRGNYFAGGLIGTTNNTAPTIIGCYSAGHTSGGSYDEWTKLHDYDVKGATAGGLIGNAGSSTISNSYSTCSVNATNRGGGFAAAATGKIMNCYCTGRVLPDFADDTLIHNAFRTQLENEDGLADGSSGYYYKIINEVQDPDTKQIEYKDPYRLPGSNTPPAIAALDENAEKYNTFVGHPNGWKDARPYDKAALGKYYNGKYNLKTVLQLAGTSAPAGADSYYVSFHYGDWPAPEIFIINN